MTHPPVMKNDEPLYRLLRKGQVDEFNRQRAAGINGDLTRCDFRGVDLRGINADGIDFSGSYFRQADLRGIDFTNSTLQGATIYAAKISGAYFPDRLSADEITMSLLHGTRLRE